MEGLENSSALISMTQAEYDALSDEERTDNNMRAILDANPDVVDAKNVNFDNTDTNLTATNTQSAITELNGKLTNIGTKIANVTINANAKEKIDIINALNTYNTKIPSGICIVNFKPDSDKNYYSGVITQKINDTYGLGIVFSYYNNSTVWIRLQDRVWKDT